MKLLALFVFSLCWAILPAQPPSGLDFCGTHGKSEWLDRYQKGEIPVAPKSAETTYVPMRIVIVGDDNGEGYASPVVMLDALNLLNEDFAEQNIQFYLAEPFSYVDNTNYYQHDTQGGRDLMNDESRAGFINVFVVDDPNGACGYYSGRADAMALGTNCILDGDRTWSHEMGHYLSLPHTFFGWESVDGINSVEAFDDPAPETLAFFNRVVEVEKTDGSNCRTAADGFCDTPPDYLPERWPCNNRGFYQDRLLDPDSIRFAVPAQNIMSYANDNCVNTFTAMQQDAMRTNLAEREDLANDFTPLPDNLDASVIQHVTPFQNQTLEVNDRVELVWTPMPEAEFYIVELNSNAAFGGNVLITEVTRDTSIIINQQLDNERRYYWRIRPVAKYRTNATYSTVTRFRNGAFSTSTMDGELDAALTLSPNPALPGQPLRLAGRDLAESGDLSFEVIDGTGRTLHRRVGIRVSTAGFTQDVPTEGLKRGIYFLRVRLNDRLVTRRFAL